MPDCHWEFAGCYTRTVVQVSEGGEREMWRPIHLSIQESNLLSSRCRSEVRFANVPLSQRERDGAREKCVHS